MATLTNKRPRSDSDNDEIDTSTIFRTQEKSAKFLIMESKNTEKPITSLSPFVIEKQIEALIGTPKSVEKMRNQTLLIETTQKIQTVCEFGFNVAFNNVSVISQRCLVVTGSSMLTFIVLPH